VIEIEVIKERHPNRSIKIERHVTQDKDRNYTNHGSWTMWDPAGAMVGKGEYWFGKRHGKWTRWHLDNEQPSDLPGTEVKEVKAFAGEEFQGFMKPFVSEATFIDGKLVGKWTMSDDENRTIMSLEFDQDRLHGKATYWYPNGEKRREVDYKNGLIDGEYLEWDDSGELARKDTYIEGRRHAEAVKNYDSGELMAEGWYLYARDQGDIKADWWNGLISFTAAPKDGRDEKHSKWTFYFRDGGKKFEGEFVRDVPVGMHVWWYENGQKEVEGQFVDGKRENRWTFWHLNGQKRAEGAFLAGQQTGQWMKWGEDGRVAGQYANQGQYYYQGYQNQYQGYQPQPTQPVSVPEPAPNQFPSRR
jgi:uncharacterized protein